MADPIVLPPPAREEPEPECSVTLADLEALWPAFNTGFEVIKSDPKRIKELEAAYSTWDSLCARMYIAIQEIKNASKP